MSCNRISHASEAAALEVVGVTRKTHDSRGDLALRPYRCRRCGQWHVGHVPAATGHPALPETEPPRNKPAWRRRYEAALWV